MTRAPFSGGARIPILSLMGISRDPRNIVLALLSLAVVGLTIALVNKSNPTKEIAVSPDLTPVTDGKSGAKQKTPYEMNQVRNTITKNTSKVKACYGQFLNTKPTSTDGKVLVDWQIQPDGRVRRAEIVSTELAQPVLERCLTDSIKTWVFPEPPSSHDVYTSFLFIFNNGADAPTQSNPHRG